MFCKIFFTYGKKWTGLQKYMDNLESKHRVITTIESLNDFLVKNNKSSETLYGKFPEISSRTREIYDNAHFMLENYRKSFVDLTYRQFELFPSIELLIFDDLVLLEKSKLILEEKKDTIFVFDRFSFAYYGILKLAKEMGYSIETGFKIGILQESGIKYLQPEDDHTRLLNRNKIHFLTTNFSKAALSGIVPYLTKSVISKTGKSIKSLDDIIKNTTSKISKMTLGNSGGVAFFFTTDIEDFLRPFYRILDQLRDNNMKFQIFSIDLSTKSILSSKKIPHADLFQEVYLLASSIKNSQDGTSLKNKLEKISDEDNLTLIYFKKLSYFIESEIYRAAAVVTICDLILSKMMPKSVGVCIDGSMYANSVTTVAKKHHILSISIEPGIVNEKLEPRDLYKADKICIYGLQGLEVLQSIGYKKERIVVTGNPRYDFLNKLEQEKSRKMLSKIHQIDARKKLITIAMGRWHENDEIWMSRFIKFCNINNIQIIIKVHPIYKTKYQTKSRKKIEFISKSCKGVKFHITYDADSSTLISASDLIITDYSNVGVEAILLNKPIITVNFAKEDINNVQRYHEYNAAIYVDEYDKMEEVVMKILSGKDILAILQEGRNRLIPRYNFHNDGKATLRVIDLLLQREN